MTFSVGETQTATSLHPTAVVDPSAQIGKGVTVGPYAVIGPEVELGDGVSVGAHAILEYVTVGKNAKIHPHAFVGTPPQDLKFKGEKTRARVGANTVIRECVTLNRGTSASGWTVVGDNCLLMAYVHVAHDCVVGNNVILANVATLAGHVEVGDDVVVGGLAAFHQFVRVGTGAMIGGGAMVASDVAPFCMAQGDRAQLAGLNAVGLRRRGLSKEAFGAVKNAYKTVFMSGLTLNDAVAKLDQDLSLKEVKLFTDFLRKPSRGLCRPSLGAASSDAA